MYDKQTLAWINKSNKWMEILRPNYKERYGGGIAENAALPYTMHPIFSVWVDRNGIERIITGDVWGFEKWHHSANLKGNLCDCPRCNLQGDRWFCEPMKIADVDYSCGKYCGFYCEDDCKCYLCMLEPFYTNENKKKEDDKK